MWGSKHTGHGDAFITSLRACCETDTWNAVLHCNLLNNYRTVHSSYIEILRLGNRWNVLYGSLNGCGAERRLWFRCVIVLYWFENTFAESVYVFWSARQMLGEECCCVVEGIPGLAQPLLLAISQLCCWDLTHAINGIRGIVLLLSFWGRQCCSTYLFCVEICRDLITTECIKLGARYQSRHTKAWWKGICSLTAWDETRNYLVHLLILCEARRRSQANADG